MSKQAEAWKLWYHEGVGKRESVSGVGSTLESTKAIRTALPRIFNQYYVKSMLDLGCGDWNWMKLVDLLGITYTGWDIVFEQIEANRLAFPDKCFEVHDVLTNAIPKVDLVLCRDLLFHLTNDQILVILENVRASGSQWLLTTTFPRETFNKDVHIGKRPPWRAINLRVEPFNLPPPVGIIEEGNSQACRGRVVGLFDVGTI